MTKDIVKVRLGSLSKISDVSLDAWGNSSQQVIPMAFVDSGKQCYIGVKENDGTWVLMFYIVKSSSADDYVELEEYGRTTITQSS